VLTRTGHRPVEVPADAVLHFPEGARWRTGNAADDGRGNSGSEAGIEGISHRMTLIAWTSRPAPFGDLGRDSRQHPTSHGPSVRPGAGDPPGAKRPSGPLREAGAIRRHGD